MSTINSTFFLKKPKGDAETLILFSCYFKHEEKKFVYSTGENIHPKNWDFQNRQPKMHGKDKAPYGSSIRTQINRYSDKFGELQARSKIYGRSLPRRSCVPNSIRNSKRARPGQISFSRLMTILWSPTRNVKFGRKTLSRNIRISKVS